MSKGCCTWYADRPVVAERVASRWHRTGFFTISKWQPHSQLQETSYRCHGHPEGRVPGSFRQITLSQSELNVVLEQDHRTREESNPEFRRGVGCWQPPSRDCPSSLGRLAIRVGCSNILTSASRISSR